MRRVLSFSVLLGAFALVACQSSDGGQSEADREQPRVVASTALLGEFASIVAGDDARVTTLIPPGIEVHSFEPAPATAAAIAEADIVFVNGYNLEEGLLDIILENVRADVLVVAAAGGLAEIDGRPADADGAVRAAGDPHFWLDVSNAVRYVEQIRDRLIALDSGSATGYRARAAAYIEQLEVLDGEVRAAIAGIPEDARELVVFHDGYRYFAAAYGLELTASLLPAGAQQDPSASAVAKLIELIEEREIPTVYREPQFGASVLNSIAGETGAEVLVIYSTFSDDVDSYVELIRANVAALVEGLGGERYTPPS